MTSRRTIIARSQCLLLVVSLCGCAETDPYQRPGEWHPVGANAANLAAMAADPHDLIMGHGSPSSPGDLAGNAAIRLRLGTTRRLPASSISKVQGTDQPSAPDQPTGPGVAAPAAATSAGASQ